MKHIHTIVLLLLAASVAFSQSTTLKLPTTANTSDFTITDNLSNVLMKVYGDGGFYLNGPFNTGTIPIQGAGTRLMWYPEKASFRAGHTDEMEWDDVNIGHFSTAFGWSCIANANYATAFGYQNTASGAAAVAFGSSSTASGNNALATGYNCTATGIASTAMGYQTTASNLYTTAMGHLTTASGSHSTAMGNYVSTNLMGGAFIIGDVSTPTVTNSTANNQMTMRFDGGYRLFTKSDLSTGVSMGNGANSWSSISDSTKKTNFQPADGEYFLSSLSKLKLGSWNYKTQDPKQFRHYGPMAQEIFHYFGHDGIGTIGNDTTLATADMDGIIMICLQALEKRTRELQEAKETIHTLTEAFHRQQEQIEEMKRALTTLVQSTHQKTQSGTISERRTP